MNESKKPYASVGGTYESTGTTYGNDGSSDTSA